jgi:2-polyprenyl-3-methyl-5-hydroxy-6-metoxy-1,4-benzoquinol methylase
MTNEEKFISCLMCGRKKSKVVHTIDSLHNPEIKGLRIVKCSDCGFVFMNPQPSLKKIASFYPTSLHESKRTSKLRFLKEIYEKKRLRDVLREAGSNSKSVLDIGCSNGFFLKLAQKKGMEIYGTELGKKQLNYLRKNVTKNVFDTEKKLVGKMKFDIITAFDVIEHLPDPESFLRNCRTLLKKGGLLVVMTMVLDSWSYKTFKGKVSWIGDQHLFYFTRSKLTELMKRNGFCVYKAKIYNNSLLHAGMFAYQIMRKHKIEFVDVVTFYARKE